VTEGHAVEFRAANACGIQAVAARGDQSGLPDRPELGRLPATDGAGTLR
jgi:hypothetical protein